MLFSNSTGAYEMLHRCGHSDVILVVFSINLELHVIVLMFWHIGMSVSMLWSVRMVLNGTQDGNTRDPFQLTMKSVNRPDLSRLAKMKYSQDLLWTSRTGRGKYGINNHLHSCSRYEIRYICRLGMTCPSIHWYDD